MTTNTSNSANIAMPERAPAAPATEPRSFEKIMSEVANEDWCSSSTPHSRSPVPEDRVLPATVHMGCVQRRREPATSTDNNEINEQHLHNVNHHNVLNERSAQQHQSHRIAQENCRNATKPCAPARSLATSSPNGNSPRRIRAVSTAPRTLGAMTGGVFGLPNMQIMETMAQNPVAQTIDRGVQFNDMRRTTALHVSKTTAETNIQDGECSQHISLVSDEPSFVVTAMIATVHWVVSPLDSKLSGQN